MSEDASLPPNAPMTNGTPVYGEADASNSSTQSLSESCANLHSRVSAFLARKPKSDIEHRTQEQTRISLAVIEKALEDYDFSSLSLSYNGGKDCLVLLILYLSTLHTFFATRQQPFPTSIPSIYARPPDPFGAVTSFIETSSRHYHLSLSHISTKGISFRDAFARYIQSCHNAGHDIKAIFVGTRRTDPHGADLTHFDRTDKGWPDFMRIHPVIDWHLSEIWCFLRVPELCGTDGQDLEYCHMYDEGYTSLGGVGDTLRNPKLKFQDSDGRERYKPAYELTEDEEERLGRE